VVQNVIRLSALAFGVRKLVSLKPNELGAKVALYNPRLSEMTSEFKRRSVTLAALLTLDNNDQLWQNLLAEINKCWEGYNSCIVRACVPPTFRGIGFTRFPLCKWHDVLKTQKSVT
jgi:hypothetical protein